MKKNKKKNPMEDFRKTQRMGYVITPSMRQELLSQQGAQKNATTVPLTSLNDVVDTEKKLEQPEGILFLDEKNFSPNT